MSTRSSPKSSSPKKGKEPNSKHSKPKQDGTEKAKKRDNNIPRKEEEQQKSDGEDFEIEPEKPVQIKKFTEPMEGNILQQPFKLGWGRELIYYGKPGKTTDVDSDVYYFSPEGKKLRSTAEVKAHLKKTNSPLSMVSFTFAKSKVYDEPYEIVRFTGRPRGKSKNKMESNSKTASKNETSPPSSKLTTEKTKIKLDSNSKTAFKGETSPASSKRTIEKQAAPNEIENDQEEFLTIKRTPKKRYDAVPNEKGDENLKNSNKIVGAGNTDESTEPKKVHRTSDKNATEKDSTIQVEVVNKHTTENESTIQIKVPEKNCTEKSITIREEDVDKVQDNDTVKENALNLSQAASVSQTDNQDATTVLDEVTGDKTVQNSNENSGLGLKITSVQSMAPGVTPESAIQLDNTDDSVANVNPTKKDSTVKAKKPWFKIRAMKSDGPKAHVNTALSPSKKKRFFGSLNLQRKPAPPGTKIAKNLSRKAKNSAISQQKDSKKVNNSKEDAEEDTTETTPTKRKRALPAHLRDYAIGAKVEKAAVESEASSGVESDIEAASVSSVASSADLNSGADFVSKLNPSNREIISSLKIGTLTPIATLLKSNVARKHLGKRKAITIEPTDLASTKKRKLMNGSDTPKAVSVSKEPIKLCDLNCPKAKNIPPTLACEKCMILFHPVCVKRPIGSKAFICPNHKNDDDEQKSLTNGSLPRTVKHPAWSLSTRPRAESYPKVITVTTRRTSKAEPWELRKLRASKDRISQQIIKVPYDLARKLNRSKSVTICYMGAEYVIPPSCVHMKGREVALHLPPNTLPNFVVKNGVDVPVSVSSGRGGNNKLNVMVLNDEASAAAIRNTLANKENDSSMQTAVSTSGTFIDSANLSAQISSLLANPGVIRLNSPLDLNALTEASANNSVENTPIGGSTETPVSTNKRRGRPKRHADSTPAAKASSKKTSAKTSKFSQPTCHFQMLHVGFDCMSTIFEFLSLSDLLRASQVCKTWRRVATQSSLWKKVRLRGYCIKDWPGAVNCFLERNVRELDLRGMTRKDGDVAASWQALIGELALLAGLQRLELPQCPAAFLHALADRLPALRNLAAESIVESIMQPMETTAKLDLGKFSRLDQLEVLKLRGSVGLEQPSFSFSGGLSQLSNLKKLHTLSITTLRNLPGSEFGFLGNLTNLQNLSVGDCTLWTHKNYEAMGKLTELRFLRCECGGSLDGKALGKALCNLTRLQTLELFKFVVSPHLADALQTIVSLRTFSIFSETNKQAAAVNRHTLTALSRMPFLTTVQWGIFDPTDSSLDLPADTVPFLPAGRASRRSSSGDGSNIEYIRVNDLVQLLTRDLADTVIRVFRVRNVPTRR